MVEVVASHATHPLPEGAGGESIEERLESALEEDGALEHDVEALLAQRHEAQAREPSRGHFFCADRHSRESGKKSGSPYLSLPKSRITF